MNLEGPPARSFKVCLHITAKDHLPSILERGLELRVGPLSRLLDEPPAVWMFPCWASMLDAERLWAAWPYGSEAALLAVNTQGPELMSDTDYEVASFVPIEPWRISVLSDTELDWNQEDFLALGGLRSLKDDSQTR